jgi:N utilization substance protein A
MSELGGEKIDIIEWSEDPQNFVADALSPAKTENIVIDMENNTATVAVTEDRLSLAIGKSGQNVRLAAKLTGFRIDIKAVKVAGEEEKEVELAATQAPVVESAPDEKPAESTDAATSETVKE